MTTRGKAKKSARTARGKAKEVVGRLTGNRRMSAEGKTEQMTARIRHLLDRGVTALRHGGKAAKGKGKEILGSATGNRRMKTEGKLGQASARLTHRFNR